jgi:N-acyl-D-aspartate/D-glutamate deacylase
MHDLLIDNAVIIDGTGAPRYRGGIAVAEGRIAELGDISGEARQRIDAEGRVVAPGIVDLHTHFDAQLTWDKFATPSVANGVTTVAIGNCGFTIAPCKPAHRDMTLRNLTHVEGMSLEALRAGIDWNFETYREYLDALETKGMVPNVASFVGHSSVRTYILGEDANKRAATPGEVAAMKALVLDAIDAGAVGFATSTLEQHNGENGVPMPSRLADEAEMFALTGALGESGKGVFMLTKGMTSTIPWLEEISRRNGRPVMIAAMFVDPNDPERVFNELGQISEARGRGCELWGQVGCFALGMEFTLRHPYPLEAFIAWHPAIEAEGDAGYEKILADPEFRAAVKAEARTKGVPNRFSYHQLDHMKIMSVVEDRHSSLVGRIVGDLAREAGADPFDWLLDFGLDGELDAMFDCKLFNMDEDRVKHLLTHDHSVIALSDAGAHLSFLCDAGFGLHLFGHWARERGDMSLEDAVRAVTSRPAEAYRIKNRGRLAPGAWADMIMFDAGTVGRGEKYRAHDLPGGASRVDVPTKGLLGVWVNGTRVVDETGPLGDCGTPGRLVRDFADN